VFPSLCLFPFSAYVLIILSSRHSRLRIDKVPRIRLFSSPTLSVSHFLHHSFPWTTSPLAAAILLITLSTSFNQFHHVTVPVDSCPCDVQSFSKSRWCGFFELSAWEFRYFPPTGSKHRKFGTCRREVSNVVSQLQLLGDIRSIERWTLNMGSRICLCVKRAAGTPYALFSNLKCPVTNSGVHMISDCSDLIDTDGRFPVAYTKFCLTRVVDVKRSMESDIYILSDTIRGDHISSTHSVTVLVHPISSNCLLGWTTSMSPRLL